MKSKNPVVCVLFVLTMAAAFAASVRVTEATPYFSRKYETECSMCHWHQPKLNSIGKKFQADGYRFSNDEAPDSSFKTINNMPLSVKMEPRFTARNNASASSDFQLHAIELQIGGSLPGGASLFIEKYLEERGEYHNAGDAFVTLALRSGGYVKIGQFKTMSHIPDSERITLSRNIVYDTRTTLGNASNSVRLRDVQRGLEYGQRLSPSTSLTASVFNGNADAAEKSSVADNNDAKSYNVEIVRSFTRTSLGGFYYGGDSAPAASQKNRFSRAGLTAILRPNYDWNIEMIGMAGTDKNLLGDNGSTRVRTRSFSTEADYMIRDGYVAYLRHGQHRISAPGYSASITRESTAGVSWMLSPAQKVTIEYRALTGRSNDGLEMELELNF